MIHKLGLQSFAVLVLSHMMINVEILQPEYALCSPLWFYQQDGPLFYHLSEDSFVVGNQEDVSLPKFNLMEWDSWIQTLSYSWTLTTLKGTLPWYTKYSGIVMKFNTLFERCDSLRRNMSVSLDLPVRQLLLQVRLCLELCLNLVHKSMASSYPVNSFPILMQRLWQNRHS